MYGTWMRGSGSRSDPFLLSRRMLESFVRGWYQFRLFREVAKRDVGMLLVVVDSIAVAQQSGLIIQYMQAYIDFKYPT